MSKWILNGFLFFVCLSTPQTTSAAEVRYVTPQVVIYPGRIVERQQLVEIRQASADPGSEKFPGIDEIAGMVAVVTLRPNVPIRLNMVRAQPVFRMGNLVILRFDRDGISIQSSGMALQNGFIGERVRVRNQESGITINGFVRNDGSVEID